MGTLLHGLPPIKIGGEWRPQGKGPHDDVESRVAYSLMHAPVLAHFLGGVTLTQVTVFKTEDGYLAMLKGTRGKRKLVAFIPANSYRAAIVSISTTLDTGNVPWRTDSPPRKG